MKAVILAGGSGTRLWPLSRKKSPKQLHQLATDHTLLQDTIERLDFLEPTDIYISTNEEYVEQVKDQAAPFGIPEKNIIPEPALRDTAPCIGFAAAYIAKEHPYEVMAVIYSDHLIKEKETFQEKLKIAEKLAKEEGTINLIPVKARYPSTNYGYIKINDVLATEGHHEIYGFDAFVEKPDLETAKEFMTSYKYLWNTGLYIWRLDVILKAYAKYAPDTYKRLMKIVNNLDEGDWAKDIIRTEYSSCEKISIDYAIMEKLDKAQVRVLPAYLGWSDLGTWDSLHRELTNDAKDNLHRGHTLSLETEGSVIYNYTDKLVATYGVKDLVIVQTEDALLICNKDSASHLKTLTAKVDDELM